jgi:short-subunit dehydrogenase
MMRALVTGASRGIGKAIALALARRGYEVIGTSRNPGALSPEERIPGALYLPLDLRDEKSIDSLALAAGEVGVLVNNAGASLIGPLEELSLEKVRRLFEVNLFGLLSLTQRLLPGMRGRRNGAIINIASFAGVTPVPFLAAYAATKSALIAVTRALRQETAPWGIKAAVVAPFYIRTTIPLEVGYERGSAYVPTVDRVRAARDRFLAEAPGPQLIADKVVQILSAARPRLFNPVGRRARLTAFLVKHLPDAVVEAGIRGRYGLD